MKFSSKLLATFSLIITFAFLSNVNITYAQQRKSTKMSGVKGKTVLKVIKSHHRTTKFASMVKESGYSGVLKKKGPFTVLAPTNKAVNAKVDMSKMTKKPKKLKALVRHHLYQGELPKNKVEKALGVKIVGTHHAANGVVYVINTVVRQAPSNG